MNTAYEFFFGNDEPVNPFIFAGRALFYLVLLIWGCMFIIKPMGSLEFAQSFMHNINLVFHEAGHVIFSPFGRLIKSAGGTLGQLLIPLIVAVTFLLKQNPFGANVGVWWLGQSFMDVAPYINDARAQKLILLGGVTGSDAPEGFHDWNFILGELGMLWSDHVLAWISHICGILLILMALVWGGWVLVRQARRLDL